MALPDVGEGGAWKASVPHAITLQAVTLALGELDVIEDGERPLALDRAEIACREATAGINGAWRGMELPGGLSELIQDARIAFEHAANAGAEWVIRVDRVVCDHPADLCERLRRAGFRGELFVGSPGVPMFRGSPVVFARGPGGAAPTEEQCRAIEGFFGRGALAEPERIGSPRQVYRQMDFASGGPVRDVVVAMHEPLPPGQPLLVLAMEGGETCPVPLPPRYVSELASLPVEVLGADEATGEP
ncbi:MAG: hypothetical protein ACF8Q5_14315 [Phycisphaerales bacterium JB040]